MSGGTWSEQNKLQPGIYINFQSAAQPLGTPGIRGVVAIPMALSWGPEESVISLANGENTFAKLGYDISADEMLLIREIFKGSDQTLPPTTLLLWRLACDGVRATKSANGLTVTALHKGARGDDISYAVTADPDNTGYFFVTTLVDGAVVDSQYGQTIGDLKSNDWVSFSGTGTTALVASTAAALVGGTDGSVSGSAYTSFLTAIETYQFNVIAYMGADGTTQGLFKSFTDRLLNDQGRYFTCVMTGYPTADDDRIISVKNGVVLADGTTLTAGQAVAWVAGASAGANYNQGLTAARYPGAVDVNTRLTDTQINAAIAEGSFAFMLERDGSVKVVYDINTFTGYTPTKGQAFSKNRVQRTIEQIANDFYRIFSDYYKGKVDNNAAGRLLLKGEFVNYLNGLQANNAVQNFISDDLTISAGVATDAVVADLAFHPVDSIDKVYMTVSLV